MIGIFASFVSGLMFAAGLAVSGMVRPSKVLSFLDIMGAWDPSLAFVMMGAIPVYFVGQRLARRRKRPLISHHFYLPPSQVIDRKLIAGAILFGIGWGIGGFCPGPAIASIATLSQKSLIFVAALLAGTAAFEFSNKRKKV